MSVLYDFSRRYVNNHSSKEIILSHNIITLDSILDSLRIARRFGVVLLGVYKNLANIHLTYTCYTPNVA